MSRAKKRELNQHLHRRHHTSFAEVEQTSLLNRLSMHEELHRTTVTDHEHDDFEEPGIYTTAAKDD
jgi:hypothetical protein